MDMYYVTIPAYQPDEKLIQLLKGIKNRLSCQVIVVDDGSSGESVEILEAARQYATVLHHEVNKGKGQTLRTAFQYIYELNKPGVVVTADADGQHAINDIDRSPKSQQLLKKTKAAEHLMLTKKILLYIFVAKHYFIMCCQPLPM